MGRWVKGAREMFFLNRRFLFGCAGGRDVEGEYFNQRSYFVSAINQAIDLQE